MIKHVGMQGDVKSSLSKAEGICALRQLGKEKKLLNLDVTVGTCSLALFRLKSGQTKRIEIPDGLLTSKTEDSWVSLHNSNSGKRDSFRVTVLVYDYIHLYEKSNSTVMT